MATSSPETSLTVMDHILNRLSALGVRHLFGMAADYNLKVLDRVLIHPRVRWIGMAHELGAAYAADAYGRVNGFGALLTTFGVGELNAINGVAGAFAERVPLLHIAVGPTRATERARLVVHHTGGDADFDRFARAHRQVVCADAVLRPRDAVAEVDRVLATCLRESRPGYLRVPRDVALAPALPSGPLDTPDTITSTVDSPDNVEAFRAAARARLARARHAAVLADFLVDRFHARAELAAFLAASDFPHATLVSGKTVVDEANPRFLGVYAGAMSPARVRAVIDHADLLILAGVLLSDYTTGKFTHEFDPDKGIDLGPRTARVDGVAFPGVPLAVALKVLTELVGEHPRAEVSVDEPEPQGLAALARHAEDLSDKARETAAAVSRKVCGSILPLTQTYLWKAVGEAVRPQHTVVADDGTAMFGIMDRRFPSGARFIGQPVWASIGYSIPALLGALLAEPSRRGLLLIGDGAAQLTVQELGTIGRHHLKPIVVLVNNDGYTIERITHGLRAPYNDIARWDWQSLPAALGVKKPLVLIARTPAALDNALARALATTDRLVLIEAFTGKDDVPPAFLRLVVNRPDRARWVP
ncbi:indolepyruvate decarboxylase [Streptoalloteichus tenebrarius]|uniref:Alpha-keto-acid decarboxylase n=1 Tax=Streptoalloteichus tenebrarius (strain ATCC 17920 / DSM 40477 / JCM 4838 / CBS 697.72 / NBRC 16177 / NCIMB 11028 / NRRL B-12390 / A12253. 1 / ISP 5477) TaxID=1933 RepID=A0ABT1HZP2_STRSD|nr:thiamine pyrophosphate-binding protein [Streptoalloteichus tenebrarius]MCP2261007.1 indolepyruvate decarboxylase [Streptoalloteichus tenebrarius]BFE98948.1 alpha-keto acid decarboxylase family protein [Streptoalloteichus tenebrarius]